MADILFSSSSTLIVQSHSRGSTAEKAVLIGLGAATAGVATVFAAPAVLGAIGFTAGGIASGSIASSLMSIAATMNGGGVAAGSLVAVGQSIGAAGLGSLGTAVVGGAGTVVTAGAAVLSHVITNDE